MQTRSSFRTTQLITAQNIFVGNPPVTSPVALVILTRKYFALDRNRYSNKRMDRLRGQWMKKQMETPDSKGGLTCQLCGRQGLNPWADDKNKMATLDHIVELSQGGVWNDPANFRVACHRCNCGRWKKEQREKLRLTSAKV